MKFSSEIEFRKLEKRTGRKGSYGICKFEDENGDILNCYTPFDKEYSIEPYQLTKGTNYLVCFDYRYNSYDKVWRLDVDDIKPL